MSTSAEPSGQGAVPEDLFAPSALHVGRPNLGDREAFLRRVEEILDRGWFTNDGPMVRELEVRIADHLGVKHCVAMCNGTVALEIAIRALGMTGEVIVPSFTFVATAHALHWQGITPVFADVNPTTHVLDPDAVRAMITPRTTGIIGVHLWGQAAPVRELQRIADDHGLRLLFDAAHAFGCEYGGTMLGNFGDAEVLSFHATKFFNSFEGGAVVTNDDELAKAMRLMRNFGFDGYDNVVYPGTNGKMTEICAAMGLVNLDSLDVVVQANIRNQEAYARLLADVPGVRLMRAGQGGRHNHQYVVAMVEDTCAASRDTIIAALQEAGILARRYFWPGVHRMQPYRDLFPHAGLMLPETERVARRVLVLPNGTAIGEAEVERIAGVIAGAVRDAERSAS